MNRQPYFQSYAVQDMKGTVLQTRSNKHRENSIFRLLSGQNRKVFGTQNTVPCCQKYTLTSQTAFWGKLYHNDISSFSAIWDKLMGMVIAKLWVV